jgi:hypothetical protein
MTDRSIVDTAVLIGWSPEGKCVYSAAIPLSQYLDGEHLWDSLAEVQRLRLEKLRGFLFDSTATLVQEFESNFDVRSGRFVNGWSKHADGTYRKL